MPNSRLRCPARLALIVMSEPQDSSPMDLGYERAEGLDPVPRLVHLILQQAVLDRADRIEFRLTNESSATGFRVTVRTGASETQLPPSPGSLFSPCVVVLCNHAAVPYYARRSVNGTIRTENPSSLWTLESDDLQQHLFLSRT